MATHQADSWHAQAHEHCIEQLAVNPTAGLSSVEVINRLAGCRTYRLQCDNNDSLSEPL